jgi:hypothetical protein
LQKRAPAGLTAPHTGQVIGSDSGWPHSMQNLALSGLFVPHLGQIMPAPPAAHLGAAAHALF